MVDNMSNPIDNKEETIMNDYMNRVRLMHRAERYAQHHAIVAKEINIVYAGIVRIAEDLEIQEWDEDEGWEDEGILAGLYEARVKSFFGWRSYQLYIDGEWVELWAHGNWDKLSNAIDTIDRKLEEVA